VTAGSIRDLGRLGVSGEPNERGACGPCSARGNLIDSADRREMIGNSGNRGRVARPGPPAARRSPWLRSPCLCRLSFARAPKHYQLCLLNRIGRRGIGTKITETGLCRSLRCVAKLVALGGDVVKMRVSTGPHSASNVAVKTSWPPSAMRCMSSGVDSFDATAAFASAARSRPPFLRL
jgi:hypothetical protein